MDDQALTVQPTAQVPAPVSEAASMLAMIERMANNPSVDIDRLERLIAMKEKIDQQAAERAFNSSMRDAQAEIPQILRAAKNEQTRSKYALLEAINAKIVPIVTKHGFSMSFGTADSPHAKHYRITCLVSHLSGHSRDYYADIPIDDAGMAGKVNKTATHAFGSTMSYGRRYLTLLIFNVATTGEDNDGNRELQREAGPISQEQVERLQNLIVEVAANIPAFCKYFKIVRLDELPASEFDRAVSSLERKRSQNNGN